MITAKQRLYNAYVSSGQAPSSTDAVPNADSLFAGNAPYIRANVRPLLPTRLDARIIDLGCGNGCYLHFFRQWGYTNLVGIDTSAEQVAMAHRLGITGVVQDTINDFLTRPQPPADVVLLMDVLEHLTLDETLTLMDQILALLNPGGILLMHVPNAEGLFGMRIRYGDLTHEQSFTRSSMRQLLMAAGFDTQSCYEDKPVIHGLTSLIRRLIWEVGTLHYRLLLLAETGAGNAILSQNMLVVAKKKSR